MNLTPRERAVISAVQLNALCSIQALARTTKLRSHTIRYILDKLIDRRILVPYTRLCSELLGVSKYRLFFSIATSNTAKRLKAEEFFLRDARAIHFSLFGGKYEYLAVVSTQGTSGLIDFLRSAESVLGEIIIAKALALESRVALFHRGYIGGPLGKSRAALMSGPRKNKIELDQKDRLILREVTRMGHPNIREISRRLNMPDSTIRARLTHLEKTGLILGYVYGVVPSRIGMHSFQLLITTRGLGMGSWEKVYAFCAAHPSIVLLSEVVGSWDLELLVEVDSPAALRALEHDIFQAFEDEILTVESLMLVEERKDTYFPVLFDGEPPAPRLISDER